MYRRVGPTSESIRDYVSGLQNLEIHWSFLQLPVDCFHGYDEQARKVWTEDHPPILIPGCEFYEGVR
jgi:hypothetical protein